MAQGKRHFFVLLRTLDGHRHHWNSRPAGHLVTKNRDVGRIDKIWDVASDSAKKILQKLN